MINSIKETNTTTAKINRYYRFHAHIYDATRWSFLFGRHALIKSLPDLPPQPNILEIGCGTGTNLVHLRRRFPKARLIGVDSSPPMLRKADNKMKDFHKTCLLEAIYGTDNISLPACDLILLSYSLTIKVNEAQNILKCINKDLKNDGYVAVVDFNATPFRLFHRWMLINNVCMNENLLPLFQKYFKTVQSRIEKAYFGLWSNFQYIGRKKNEN